MDVYTDDTLLKRVMLRNVLSVIIKNYYDNYFVDKYRLKNSNYRRNVNYIK